MQFGSISLFTLLTNIYKKGFSLNATQPWERKLLCLFVLWNESRRRIPLPFCVYIRYCPWSLSYKWWFWVYLPGKLIKKYHRIRGLKFFLMVIKAVIFRFKFLLLLLANGEPVISQRASSYGIFTILPPPKVAHSIWASYSFYYTHNVQAILASSIFSIFQCQWK